MRKVSRPLTQGEMAGLRPVFGDAVDVQRVRVHRGWDGNLLALAAFWFGNRAIALGRHIHVARGAYRDDYAGDAAGLGDFIVHEMVHVWQWAGRRLNPALYLSQYLTWPHRGYDVRHVTAASRFDALGYDQQAEVARLWFLATCGAGAVSDAERLGPVLHQCFPKPQREAL